MLERLIRRTGQAGTVLRHYLGAIASTPAMNAVAAGEVRVLDAGREQPGLAGPGAAAAAAAASPA